MSAGSLSAGRLPGSRALLWIGGLAAALVAARAALRGLHVPGHAALPALFLLVLGASRVRVPGAAFALALPAAAGASLGVLAGPGGAASLLLAALVVEAAAWGAPRFVASAAACAAVGALAGAMRFVRTFPSSSPGFPIPARPPGSRSPPMPGLARSARRWSRSRAAAGASRGADRPRACSPQSLWNVTKTKPTSSA